MGLLDDAIRDHLELKRRRGADPAEIERLERDALGPARREPEPFDSEPIQPDPDAYAPTEIYTDDPSWAGQESEPLTAEHRADSDEQLQPAGSSFSSDEAALDHDEVDEGRAYENLSAADSPGMPATEESELPVHAPEAPEPAGEEPPHPADQLARDDPESAGRETVEYSLEDREAAEPAHSPSADSVGEEDVLEETPDFLQDTPDHDRLWFEQRPPKDFDFGG